MNMAYTQAGVFWGWLRQDYESVRQPLIQFSIFVTFVFVFAGLFWSFFVNRMEVSTLKIKQRTNFPIYLASNNPTAQSRKHISKEENQFDN